MKLQQILDQWAEDCKVNIANLGNAALNVAKLHCKYYNIYANEKLTLRKMEEDHKVLRHEKTVFYQDGPTEDQVNKGWELPPKGRILKSDVPAYVDADQDIVKSTLRLAYQQEKVDALKSIIQTVDRLGFQIKTAVDFEKFKAGG